MQFLLTINQAIKDICIIRKLLYLSKTLATFSEIPSDRTLCIETETDSRIKKFFLMNIII